MIRCDGALLLNKWCSHLRHCFAPQLGRSSFSCRFFDFFTFPPTDVDATKAVAPKQMTSSGCSRHWPVI